jgi:hypothetical protein
LLLSYNRPILQLLLLLLLRTPFHAACLPLAAC